MQKKASRKIMKHINMLETRLKQITKKTKLAEQETLIDKIIIRLNNNTTNNNNTPTFGAILNLLFPSSS